MYLDLFSNDNLEQHVCSARREGDWVIFTCPNCPSFERRINLETGEMKNRPSEDPFILHSGYVEPVGFEVDLYRPN